MLLPFTGWINVNLSFTFRQGLSVRSRLTLHSQSSCLSPKKAMMTGMSHHTQQETPFDPATAALIQDFLWTALYRKSSNNTKMASLQRKTTIPPRGANSWAGGWLPVSAPVRAACSVDGLTTIYTDTYNPWSLICYTVIS